MGWLIFQLGFIYLKPVCRSHFSRGVWGSTPAHSRGRTHHLTERFPVRKHRAHTPSENKTTRGSLPRQERSPAGAQSTARALQQPRGAPPRLPLSPAPPPLTATEAAPLTHTLRVQLHGRHLLQRDVTGTAIPAPAEAAKHGGGHSWPGAASRAEPSRAEARSRGLTGQRRRRAGR